MSINPDQAIFDAIVAAISYDGGILINVQKFIDTFNGHRDRKLCTSLDVAQAPHKVMTPEEYSAFRITGWHEVCQNVDGFYGVGVRFLGAAQTPPDQFMDDYKRDTTNAMAAHTGAGGAARRGGSQCRPMGATVQRYCPNTASNDRPCEAAERVRHGIAR